MFEEPAYITADRLSQLLSAMINRLLNRFVLSSAKLRRENDSFCQSAENLKRMDTSADNSVIYEAPIGGIKENL